MKMGRKRWEGDEGKERSRVKGMVVKLESYMSYSHKSKDIPSATTVNTQRREVKEEQGRNIWENVKGKERGRVNGW